MYVKVILVVLLAVVVHHLVKIMYLLGFHHTVYNHQPGPCRLIPGVDHGSESMEMTSKGLVFISTGMRLPNIPKHTRDYFTANNVQGGILLFDFNRPENNVTNLPINEEFDRTTFSPHGIGLYEDKMTGKITLFVINHFPGAEIIEKFEFVESEKRLQHVYSYMDSSVMRVLNDVAATGENSFYFTNMQYYVDYFRAMLELFLLLPYGNVVYYDGSQYTTVAEDVLTANGISLSQDNSHVYVACPLSRNINVYRREENDDITLIQEIPLYLQPDNVLVEPKSGNLLIGVAAELHKTIKHLHLPSIETTSKVLMLPMKNASHPEGGITELYSDDGHSLWGACSALIYNKQMLIGTMVHKLLYCEIRNM